MEENLNDNQNFIHNKYGYCYYQICGTDGTIVYNLYIKSEYRRKGHAKHLMRLIINEIRESGYDKEILIKAEPYENSISIEKLIDFYKSMGLKII